MSKRKIELALAKKGITAKVCDYNHQATPGGMMGGWDIQLDEAFDEELSAQGFDTNPDCENAREVLDWVSTLPNCFDAGSAA